MDIYSDDMTFNTFHEKKKKDIKVLNVLNDFVKPNPYFVYYMFKDTIHVDDYGSIKETLFKFPSMTKVFFHLSLFNCSHRTNQIQPIFIYSVMMWILRSLSVMTSMKTNGQWESFQKHQSINFTNVLQQ
jgi:hypothetical protein